VKITSDQSEQISMMVSGLQDSIISGLILVVGVLLFFLGVRNSSIVALSIPLSMLLTFIILQVMGISLNMVVLFSLILVLGMLVDDAIVVVENIHRYREAGHSNASAARLATGEVAIPVISSTLTTMAGFAPLLFWPDIVGEFMKYLPLTVMLSLACSLFVALIIVPVLAAMFLRLDTDPEVPATRWTQFTLIGAAILFLLYVASRNPLTALLFLATGVGLYTLNRFVFHRVAQAVQNRILPNVLDNYERRLNWALNRRWTVVGITGAVFVATFVLFGFFNAGVEFFPESIPPPTVYVQIDVPSGTNAAFTNDVAAEIESRLNEVEGMSDAETIVATIRQSTGGADMFSNA
jgi:multidrug efflux pump subunit AcrB